MPTYKKNPTEVTMLANAVLAMHESHKPIVDHGVKIDFLFAYPKYDDNDKPVGDAIKQNGIKALGLCRKTSLKDRVKGMGDAEILVDYEWWKDATEAQQMALLDHELHHIQVNALNGVLKTDDAGRPVLRLRKHDVQVGWFKVVSERNGVHSQERIQAAAMMEAYGQYFWPAIANVDHVEHAVKAMRVVR